MRNATLPRLRGSNLARVRFRCQFPTVSLRTWLAALVVIYLVGFSIVRLFLFNYLEHDEAEELFRSQTLSWGYTAQPPLYAWLLWGVTQLLGVGVLSLTLLKTFLLACLYLLLDRVTHRVIVDPRLARLATVSPLLIPLFAWEMPRMAVSLLLCVATLGTLLSLMRIRDAGKARDFILLGVWLAAGMLAKYNFILFAAPLLLASLLIAESRRHFLSWRLGLTLLVGSILVAPHAVWVAENFSEIVDRIAIRSGITGSNLSLLAGIKSLSFAFLLNVAAMLLVAGVCFHRMFPRLQQALANDQARLVGLFLVGAMGAMVLLVIAGGVRNFRVYWIAPILLLTPVWILSRLDGMKPTTVQLQRYSAIAALGAFSAVLIQVLTLCFDYEGGKFQTRDFLFAEEVKQVQSLDFAKGQIIASDPIIAGYHRLYFPDSAVHCLSHPSAPTREGFENGPWLIVWNATSIDGFPEVMSRYLESRFELKVSSAVKPTVVEVPARSYRSSMTRLGYLLIFPGVQEERIGEQH